MKTNHLQSLQARVAMLITFYEAERKEVISTAKLIKDDNPRDTRSDKAKSEIKSMYRLADTYINRIKKLAFIQKDIKASLRGHHEDHTDKASEEPAKTEA